MRVSSDLLILCLKQFAQISQLTLFAPDIEHLRLVPTTRQVILAPSPILSSAPLEADLSTQDHHGLWSTQPQQSQPLLNPGLKAREPGCWGLGPRVLEGPVRKKWVLLRRQLLCTHSQPTQKDPSPSPDVNA